MEKAIDEAFGVGVIQRVACSAKGLVTPILEEIQKMRGEQEVVILATVKCVAHADAVEGSQKVGPAGVLDCSTVVGMDAGGRLVLLETIGARPAGDEWARRHFKNRS